MLNLFRLAVLILALVLVSTPTTRADVPTTMNVQGAVADSAGNPLPVGLKIFTFQIFNAETGGLNVWPFGVGEQHTILTGSNGEWTACLGEFTPILPAVFSADTVRWLQIIVSDGLTITDTLPRIRLKTQPYAFHAGSADQLGGLEAGDFALATHGHTATWTSLPFAAGIDDYVDIAGTPYQRCQFRKIGDIVYLRGMLISSSGNPIGSGTLLATLPVGFRPPAKMLHPRLVSTVAAGGSATRFINIETNGQIVISGSDNIPWIPLSGIQFSVTP